MKTFVNYLNEKCYLTDEQEKHIVDRHSEMTIELIACCLKFPNEIRYSSASDKTLLYYLLAKVNRYYCVVLKMCSDGNFISTAYSTTKIKMGKVVYREDN